MLEETARPLNPILLVKIHRAAYVNLLDHVTAVPGDLQPQRIIFTQGTKPSVALFFLACVFSILGAMCVKNCQICIIILQFNQQQEAKIFYLLYFSCHLLNYI